MIEKKLLELNLQSSLGHDVVSFLCIGDMVLLFLVVVPIKDFDSLSSLVILVCSFLFLIMSLALSD